MASTTTTQNNQRSETNPYAPAQQSLKDIMQGARGLYAARKNQQFFPGQTYAGFGQQSEQALRGISQRAQAGSQLLRDAQSGIGDTMGGKYLADGNPFAGQVAQRTAADVMPGLNATFARGGRTGSDAHQYTLARGLGDAMAPIHAQGYENERNRMMQAAGMAPGLAQADYYDLNMARQVGAERDQMAQRGIDEQMARFNFDQNRDGAALQELLGYAQGVGKMGSSGTSSGTQTQTQQQSPAQMALGAGLMGASMFTGMPMGGMGGMGAASGFGGMGMGTGWGSQMPYGGGFVGTGNYAPYGSLPWQR